MPPELTIPEKLMYWIRDHFHGVVYHKHAHEGCYHVVIDGHSCEHAKQIPHDQRVFIEHDWLETSHDVLRQIHPELEHMKPCHVCGQVHSSGKEE